MKVSLCTIILSVSQCSFSAFWQAENAISAHSSTGLINSMILYILKLGIRNICINHLLLFVNSESLISNTRIQHLKSCISMCNDESVIYVLVSWVLHNVHFRHFGELKMWFLLICQRVLLSQWFSIYFLWN